MEFGRAWKDLKASFRDLMSNAFENNFAKQKKMSGLAENLNGAVVRAQEGADDESGPWENMVPK